MEKAGELDAAHLSSVRLFTFCGEVLRGDQVAKLFGAQPNAIVLNTYGPTEATVAVTCRRLTKEHHARLCSPSAPVGAAIGDMRLYLEGGGDEGEIVIAGPQLAAGYWGDEALTSAKFRDFADRTGVARAFYTGDYAARIDGELYFLGRRDDMVKLRGHRVHLGEIRQALGKLGWQEAFVFERDGSIFTAVEQADGLVFDEAKLIADLSAQLDSYFVPAMARCVARFPRTGNDKVDGDALRSLFD